MRHKFSVGQMVELVSAPRLSNRPSGPCRIIVCLPYERSPLQYRVQASGETVERVVSEDDLRPTTLPDYNPAESEAVFGGIRVTRR